MSSHDDLMAIFDADRALHAAEERFLTGADQPQLSEALANGVGEALALDDPDEAAIRLCRLADLCAQVPGPAMADALIGILGHDDPAVRVAAGEALLEMGYERYAEMARGVERALDRGISGPAAAELPWIVAEIGEPSAVRLIGRFLSLADADAVAAAVESLAELGDPAAVPLIAPLADDPRQVSFEDADEDLASTVGELAQACLAALGAEEDP